MLLKLKELWIVFKEFWTAFWDFILGFFLYSRHFRRQERMKREQDEHYYFREQSKKKMSKWVIKERSEIDKFLASDKIPKKYKDDYAIFNYVASVLMQKNPNWTVERTMKHFYEYLHPYMIGYWSLYRHMKGIVNSNDARGEFSRKLEGLRKRINGIPDVYNRAQNVLDLKKKISLEIRDLENKHKKHKRQVEEKLDMEMVKIDREIAEKQRRDAESKIKELESVSEEKPKEKKKKKKD
ncbi:MAG: hypothetical protein OXE50_15985 [Chloroflexi bacterium]|nr:hypothetical protein [Chloroflexota bacterium]